MASGHVLTIESPGLLMYLFAMFVMVAGVIAPIIYVVAKNKPEFRNIARRSEE
jgi:hypothetical protein